MHQLFTSRLKRITSEGQGAASNVQPTSVRLHRVGSVFPRHSMPIPPSLNPLPPLLNPQPPPLNPQAPLLYPQPPLLYPQPPLLI
ncbi:hypothetical protein M8J76_004047 [Diaphorina citri]|nr:hypothetical protein M8J76_004047 [Diaphorina citri]